MERITLVPEDGTACAARFSNGSITVTFTPSDGRSPFDTSGEDVWNCQVNGIPVEVAALPGYSISNIQRLDLSLSNKDGAPPAGTLTFYSKGYYGAHEIGSCVFDCGTTPQ
jgi:hypothetical protein